MEEVNYSLYQHLSTRQLLKQRWFMRTFLAATATLTLASMGSAILPLAAAFADTGIIAGLLVMLIVAVCNAFTSKLLLRQSYLSSSPDYETLAFNIAGPLWKFFTELCIFGLVWGSLVGGIQQLGEAGAAGLQMLWCPQPPMWLLEPGTTSTDAEGLEQTIYAGKYFMLLYVAVLVLPWCFVKEMKQLEYAMYVSFPAVIAMAAVIVVRCIQLGFPAIANGQLAVGGFGSITALSSCVATFGFAFYCQPFMMPLLAEMPPGRVGVQLTSLSMRTVLYGMAFGSYFIIGFFGAALWGQTAVETGNVLQNSMFGDPSSLTFTCPSTGQGVINLLVTVYLAFAIPPVEYTSRYTMDGWLEELRVHTPLRAIIPPWGTTGGYWRGRVVALLNLGSATGLAFVMKGNSAMVLEVIGATGVLLVSYVIPIVNHFIMYFNLARCQRLEAKAMAASGEVPGDLTAADFNAVVEELQDMQRSSAVSNRTTPSHLQESQAIQTYRDSAVLTATVQRISIQHGSVQRLSVTAGGSVGTLKDVDEMAELRSAVSKIPGLTGDARSYMLCPVVSADYHPSPLHYRMSKRLGALSLAFNIVFPLAVVAFGVLTSFVTLREVDWTGTAGDY